MQTSALGKVTSNPGEEAAVISMGFSRFSMFSPQEARVERGKHQGIVGLRVLREGGFVYVAGSTTPTVVTSPIGCPRFSEVEMAGRRDLGGGGEDPEEPTQRMIERIWESLTDIRMRMDQQASVPLAAVPPVAGVHVASVVPPLGVEVPYVAPVPPPPPVAAEEPVMQIEKFLRLQPPTYTGGPNSDRAEHWIHEIERVFTTMRCPEVDKVVLAAYQLRGFAQQWWQLKM
ncbi:hypothetical protein Taro_014946 [Colocasia esculenta]|uniref:Uncharacterized protein n=1 Tax=Colocasia esculenta TaxID=4460 RepID=A0A843UG29_COLES|nr:hypothetical protein [Colocasia esculenta]